MLNKGRSEEELFTFLAEKKSADLGYEFILSSMCTVPHSVAVWAHCMFMETNLGDPGLFPGTMALEQLLIQVETRAPAGSRRVQHLAGDHHARLTEPDIPHP